MNCQEELAWSSETFTYKRSNQWHQTTILRTAPTPNDVKSLQRGFFVVGHCSSWAVSAWYWCCTIWCVCLPVCFSGWAQLCDTEFISCQLKAYLGPCEASKTMRFSSMLRLTSLAVLLNSDYLSNVEKWTVSHFCPVRDLSWFVKYIDIKPDWMCDLEKLTKL